MLAYFTKRLPTDQPGGYRLHLGDFNSKTDFRNPEEAVISFVNELRAELEGDERFTAVLSAMTAGGRYELARRERKAQPTPSTEYTVVSAAVGDAEFRDWLTASQGMHPDANALSISGDELLAAFEREAMAAGFTGRYSVTTRAG
jgi:hypothetical protein